ncbi:MAG: HAD-IIA family hydrolase [Candidatus Methanomethylophilaceae archaeon]|nr:HAD-IIA family hydrolase [Candidatus Methanomethylophilaceae archaeon]
MEGLMIDMDGTVYKGGNVIPGAPEFIGYLKDKGIPFVFLTNNSAYPRRHYLEKLQRMGFQVDMDNVLTSTVATIRFILDQRPGSKVYPIASPGVMGDLEESGIDIVDDDPDIVLLTFDRTIDYDKINKGYRFIKNGAELIATHPDDLCPTEDDYDVDIGPFIRMFEGLCDVKATVIGKPNALMLRMAASEMGIDPDGAVMVGDRLYTDMEMAVRAGTGSILVLTGETSKDDLERSGMHPTWVLDSVADIPALIEGARNQM